MHPAMAREMVTQQIGDLHVEATAQRRGREASRPRRSWLAVRRLAAGRTSRPTAARGPQPTG
jgi:hypothetical protein